MSNRYTEYVMIPLQPSMKAALENLYEFRKDEYQGLASMARELLVAAVAKELKKEMKETEDDQDND